MSAVAEPLAIVAAGAGWALAVISAQGGTVITVEMVAAHEDGRAERFHVGLWPAGWRILRRDLTIPARVRRAAIRLAAEGTCRS